MELPLVGGAGDDDDVAPGVRLGDRVVGDQRVEELLELDGVDVMQRDRLAAEARLAGAEQLRLLLGLVDRDDGVDSALLDQAQMRGLQGFLEDRQHVDFRDGLRRHHRHRAGGGGIDRVVQAQYVAQDRLGDLVHVGIGEVQRHVARSRRARGRVLRTGEGLRARVERGVVLVGLGGPVRYGGARHDGRAG